MVGFGRPFGHRPASASWVDTVVAIVWTVTIVYVVCMSYRVYLFVRSTRADVSEVVTDEEARAVPDATSPPIRCSSPPIASRRSSTSSWRASPASSTRSDRLEVLLLVEADDDETIDAVRDADPGQQFKLVLVPPAEPRTKPKALNFGLTLARGRARGHLRRRGRARPPAAAAGGGRHWPARARRGLRAGQALVQQPRAEPHHPVVHHRVRHVVLVLPPRPGLDAARPSPWAARRTISAGWRCGRSAGGIPTT